MARGGSKLDHAIRNSTSKRSKRSIEIDLEKYQTIPEIEDFLTSVETKKGAALMSIGKSFEGRDIWAVTIGKKNRPKIVIDCGVHAREWISPAFCLWLIDGLTGNHRALTNSITWIIYPLLNPDGYYYSYTRDRFWRKNRSKQRNTKCLGVDLNRNYDVDWGSVGVSKYPCSLTYAGTGAFSEPESIAHKRHVESLQGEG